MIILQVKGLTELLRLAGSDLGPTMRAILLGIGEQVRDQLTTVPMKPKYPIAWVSEKQRRYVMALVREHGPWVRESHPLSQRLIASWTVQAESNSRVMVAAGGKGKGKVTYAGWVQDADYQQPFHEETGWITDEQAIYSVSRSGAADTIAAQAIGHFLEGR